jgi:5-methylcytosine-specific restriction endonuclease McrA
MDELDTKNKCFTRDNFTCQKCNFQDKSGKDLKIHKIKTINLKSKEQENNFITLCSICNKYAPEKESEFFKYLNEKIDGSILETFRKSKKSISLRTK